MARTPAPWRIPTPSMGFSSIIGPNDELIFGLAAGGAEEKQPDEVCEANAALIQAAPELLEAVRLLLLHHAETRDDIRRDDRAFARKAYEKATS